MDSRLSLKWILRTKRFVCSRMVPWFTINPSFQARPHRSSVRIGCSVWGIWLTPLTKPDFLQAPVPRLGSRPVTITRSQPPISRRRLVSWVIRVSPQPLPSRFMRKNPFLTLPPPGSEQSFGLRCFRSSSGTDSRSKRWEFVRNPFDCR